MPLFGAVALVTMTLGNFAALTQNNLKRLFAYSSISHAGYILLGLAAGNETGLKGISLYILVYIFMNFGVFALIAAMRREGQAAEDIDDLGGLVHRHPGYAILMLVLMLSLAGIPPMAGFYGKYFIFLGLLEAGQYMLAIFAALYVAVSAYYYFRIVRAMFLTESEDPATISPGLGTKVALVASAALTLLIGLYPEPFITMATDSILLALR
jgi:NADH-quinone oxidoreductase subunit N